MDRRKFMGTAAAGAAALGVSNTGIAGTGYDLVLQDVKALIDGAFKNCDIGISGTKIAKISDSGTLSGDNTISGEDYHVSPGWVDLHVHFVDRAHKKFIGASIKRIGSVLGVTAVQDCGTTGAANYDRLINAANDDAGNVDAFGLVYIVKEGIKVSDYLIKKTGLDDLKALAKCQETYPDQVSGIKYRADKSVTPTPDREYYLKKCRESCDELGLPLTVHFGPAPPTLTDILKYLKEGDTITHCFRGPGNSMINSNGKLLDSVVEAKKRGVRFDVGHGMGSFDFGTCEAALDNGFDDIIISSDLYFPSTILYAKTFANVLTQFVCLGMPLEDIMYKASTKPAKCLGIEREIKEGAEASLSVFTVKKGDFICTDVHRNKRKSDRRIFPEWTILKGKAKEAGEFDRKIYL
jgi:dihydroorotase